MRIALACALAALCLAAAYGFSRARDDARREASLTNLGGWGVALVFFRSREKRWPDDLETLVRRRYAGQAADPVDPLDLAPPVPAGSEVACSYAYVGPLPVDPPDDLIVMYLRPGVWEGERAVLSVGARERDGEPTETAWSTDTAWSTEEQLHDAGAEPRLSLAASYARLREAMGDRIAPERDAELRRFYEVDRAPGQSSGASGAGSST